MKNLTLAWRNVFRQKRRTLVTLSALIIGLAALVVFQGFITQMMNGFRDGTIRGGLGHLQIAGAEAYYEDGEFNPYSYPLKDQDKITGQLGSDRRVQAVFPSTGFTSIAGFGEKSATLLVKAFPADRMFFTPAGSDKANPPQAAAGQFSLGKLVEGHVPSNEGQGQLVLGATAARILKAKTGDTLTLMAVLPGGALNARDFTVCGIYEAAGKDKLFAFTDFSTARELTGLTAAPVLHVLLKDLKDTDAVAGSLASSGFDGSVRTWPRLAAFFVQVNTMFNGFLQVIRLIILLITLFILANTMNRIVLERMREWGTLRAFGTKRTSLVALVVWEGALQGAVGAVLGIAAGFGIALLLNLAGGLPYVTENKTLVHIKVLPDDQSVWWNLIPVTLTAALAALFPALKAARTVPAESLRHL